METFDLDEHDIPSITADYVLSQIDDVLILRYYMGEFELGKLMKSPLREDRHPSFKITLNKNWLKLQYKDWSTGEVGDCFKLVARKFNISWVEAVHKVACDFGLVKGCSTVTKKELEEARAFKELFQQQEYLIQAEIRLMSEPELDYWKQYNISKEDLKANAIYAIKTLWVNKKQFHLRPGLHFAYYFPTVDKFKIYSPLDKIGKWFGNVSSFQMEGVEELIPSTKLPIIITKSRKDRIILSKLYPNVCSCQNEAETAIPKEVDQKLDNMFPAKYCWFDTDEAGKNANRKLNYRGYKWINVPNSLYEQFALKDPGDVIKHFGWEVGSNILLEEMKKKFNYEPTETRS